MSDGLLSGLQAEYEAIFTYGAAGAHLSGDRLEAVTDAETTHRDRRDAVLEMLASSDADIPSPQASYTAAAQVSDADSAATAVTDVEARTVHTWRAALYETEGDGRRLAAEAYGDATVTLARWNRLIDVSPSLEAFPGRE